MGAVGVAILLTDLLPMANGLLFSGESIVRFLLFQDFCWMEASEEVEEADDVVNWVSRQVTSKYGGMVVRILGIS